MREYDISLELNLLFVSFLFLRDFFLFSEAERANTSLQIEDVPGIENKTNKQTDRQR